MDERGMRVIAALDAVSTRYAVSLAAVALAWLMTRPAVTAPIVSAASTAQLRELLTALNLELDCETLQQLDEASRPLTP